ncbi:DDE-type integrase/transposase/recombinase [Bradyrhizobium sp. LA6.10]|uniref:DDE-type integrase/transposase/recombinase n=1 Tax=Bradyrhizobium sp. LA6.10 TaxID=3156318 RepID=UPI003398127D
MGRRHHLRHRVGSFVYIAVILDAWSRRVVGYAISRSIDARLTLAALSAAIEGRNPPLGCVHHSDRGSQYAAKVYRDYLAEHGIKGSMGRRGNPYDNAKAESFMKTLKVEGIYPMAFETLADVVKIFPNSSTKSTIREGYTQLSATSALYNLKSNTPGGRSILVSNGDRKVKTTNVLPNPIAVSRYMVASRRLPRRLNCVRNGAGG